MAPQVPGGFHLTDQERGSRCGCPFLFGSRVPKVPLCEAAVAPSSVGNHPVVAKVTIWR